MYSDVAVQVDGLSKCYQIYEKPHDRLMQMLSRGRKQYFHEFWALKNVTFEVKKGETVGIIGRNGSGKSTLLQMICGTLTPTVGKIHTCGRVAALLELGSGFNPEFTGRENVYMAASLYGLSKQEISKRFDEIAAFADIGDFIDQPVKIYSSGMYVRLAFAVIAHVDADILVVDEALAVGDALFTQKCMRFIRKFREEHSLLFVSHDTSAVINLCDRAIWLDEGNLVETGPSKEVCDSYLNKLFDSLSDMEKPKQASRAYSIKRLGDADLIWKDHRADFVNNSNLRNDLEVFKFKSIDSGNFGGDDAIITNVVLLDSNGNPLNWIVGGEKVCLRVEATSAIPLKSPIIGFFIRDRLGQTLFGDNTYLSFSDEPHQVSAGEFLSAEFDFFMPWLAQGDYVIQVAIAEGTQAEHRQLHWIHDALVFRSHHSPVSTGIIGVPMLDIRLFGNCQNNQQY